LERLDPDKVWYPQRQIDYAEMETEAAAARYDERHKDLPYHDGTFPADLSLWAKDRSESHPYRFDAGVTVYVAAEDSAPHDHFLGGGEGCEECSGVVAAGELPGESDQGDDSEERSAGQ